MAVAHAGDTTCLPVRWALDYLLQQFEKPDASLAKAARHANVSHWHLSRTLKQATGHTWRTHLSGTRVMAAAHLLAATTLRIKEIADRSGHWHTATLDHEFDRWIHMTPREYRRSVALEPSQKPGGQLP